MKLPLWAVGATVGDVGSIQTMSIRSHHSHLVVITCKGRVGHFFGFLWAQRTKVKHRQSVTFFAALFFIFRCLFLRQPILFNWQVKWHVLRWYGNFWLDLVKWSPISDHRWLKSLDSRHFRLKFFHHPEFKQLKTFKGWDVIFFGSDGPWLHTPKIYDESDYSRFCFVLLCFSSLGIT